MAKSPDQSASFHEGENPEERTGYEAESEPRYKPPDYRVVIPVEVAKEDIEKNFPGVTVELIELLRAEEGINNVPFRVNGTFIFRFARHAEADASVEKEIRILPEIQTRIDLAIPVFEYVGRQRNGLRFVGYKEIQGRGLEKSDLIGPEGRMDDGLVRQLADFFKQIHSIDVETAKSWGVPEENLHEGYAKQLQEARKDVYRLVAEAYPLDTQQIKDYIEQLFAKYFADRENFEFEPVLLHHDLAADHIIFDRQSKKIAGIVDWGSVRIGDPDYDLWRPYRDFGKEFIDTLLRHYPHPAPERLFQKLDFFYRAQMIRLAVRSIAVGDREVANRQLERLRKHALGLAYWYDEFDVE